MDNDHTVWENIGDINQHTIIYAGNPDWVGIMVQIDDKMYPLTYPVEPMSKIISSAHKQKS